MNLLSGVRLGAGLNLIPDVRVYTLNKLLIFTQPAHLACARGASDRADPDLPVGGHYSCARVGIRRGAPWHEPRRQAFGR